MAYGTVNADVIGTSVAGSNLGAGDASLMKNRIINGQMVIDQRNAGASYTQTGGNTYTLDRWVNFAAGSVAGKLTYQQNAGSVTPPAGFTNYLGVTSTSAYSVSSGDIQAIAQAIEGFNTADLDFGKSTAKTITVSFWVRSSLTGTFGASLLNGAGSYSYPFTYTISSANTWEQKSVTVAGPTAGTWVGATNGIGLYLVLSLGTGSTYLGTAGSWSANGYYGATGQTNVSGTSGATFYITGVQLEVGSSATGFEYRQYQQELALCQRYYWPLRGTTATPSFIARNTAGAAGQGPGLNIKFPQPFRSLPTATQVGSWTQSNTSGGAGPTTPTCFTNDYVTFYVDSAAAGDCFYYLNGTSNGFNFSAEL